MKLLNKLRLCWDIVRFAPGNLYRHAERELLRPNVDEMQALMNRCLLDLVAVFSTQGHSGFSASYAQQALSKLLQFEPLRPLQGTNDEWVEVADGLWQNNRCSRVFKNLEGAYDIQGRVFRESSGACYSGIESRVPIVFPYTPVTEYVDVPEMFGG